MKEALNMVLEALERYSGVDQRACDAEDALRTAIEAAEKMEPRCAVIVEVFGKDWRLDYMSLPVGKHKLYTQNYVYTTPPAAQPAQEPVGKFAKFTDGVWREVTNGSSGVPLYTTPPQRPWVGLTEERIKEIWLKGKDHGNDWKDVLALARSFEAELKELNA